MVHVPYRGTGPALADLLGGQVQVMFATMPAAIEYIKTAKLRALAVKVDTEKVARVVKGSERVIRDFSRGVH